MLTFKPPTCPQCNERIWREHLKDWKCPSCHTDIGFADSYRRFIGLLTFASISLIATATHKSSSGGTWILSVVLLAIPVWLIFIIIVPPWLKRGHNQPKITIVSSWLGTALSVFVFEFLGFGTAYVLLGASQSELQELLDMLSSPLAWISPNFLLTPAKSLLDVCGVILGNSVFFGLLIFACYQLVWRALRRTRPTRLSISGSNDTEDDES
jgi:predicted RNA-binding Zn-ribbon protein involved in translation (DUF1610 family)